MLVENEGYGPKMMTQQPINVGPSVIALRYRDGVMVAADTSTTYGGMLMHRDVQRILPISENTVIAASGEMADLEELRTQLANKTEADYIENDGSRMKPREYWNYLARVLFGQRMKADPYWNSLTVAGWSANEEQPFLGTVDMYGTKLEVKDFALSGLSLYYCQAFVQSRYSPDLSYEDAQKIVEDCIRVLFYRDKRAIDTINISTVTRQGISIGQPYRVETDWSLDFYKNFTNEKCRPARVPHKI